MPLLLTPVKVSSGVAINGASGTLLDFSIIVGPGG